MAGGVSDGSPALSPGPDADAAPRVSGNDPARVPTVSIILPVYNGERYLAAAIESVLAQSFADFELIAVDDCSTDATPAILAAFAARDPRIRVLTNAANRKLPASLNVGFRVARGAWFSWTSDDNILLPTMLERLLAEAAAHPEADIIHADYRLIDAAGVPGERISVASPDQLIFGNCIGACFLYRRAVDEGTGGYDETLFGIEDYDFWMRAARNFRFRTLNEELYLYRRHEASLTSERARQITAMAGDMIEREIDRMPRSPRRAEAYVRLFCRDGYHLRPGVLKKAWRDDKATIWRERGRIVRWMRYSMKKQIIGSAAIAGTTALLAVAAGE